MMTAADLSDSLARLADQAAACPAGALTVHELAIAQSALQTLAGMLGSMGWRLGEEAHARELELERAAAAAAAATTPPPDEGPK